MKLINAFSKSKTIEEIIAPMRRIVSDLEAYSKEQAKVAETAEADALKKMQEATDAQAETRRALALSNHYRLLVDGPEQIEPTAVAAE